MNFIIKQMRHTPPETEKYNVFYIACFAMSILSIAFIAIMQSIFVYTLTSANFGTVTGVILTLLSVSALVGGFHSVVGITIRSFIRGWFTKSPASFFISVFGLLLSTGLFLSSWRMSVHAAPTLSKLVYTKAAADTINTQYSAEKAAIAQTIAAAQNTKWRGSITREATKIIQNAQKQDAELNTRIAQDNARADKVGTQLKDFFAVTSGVFEVVLFITLLLMELMAFQSVNYDTDGDGIPDWTDDEPTTPLQEKKPAPSFSPIGFKNIVLNENSKNDNSGAGTKSCAHCNASFVSNHKKQRFCSTQCRMNSWETIHGKKIKLQKSS